MKLVALVAALSAVCCLADSATAQQRDTTATGRPPTKFRGEVSVRVVFANDVGAACERAGLETFTVAVTEGCSVIGGREPIIILPNPCSERGQFATKACHEIGHVNGWPPFHNSSRPNNAEN